MLATSSSKGVIVPGKGTVTTIRTVPVDSRSGWQFIYAPGAGSNVNDAFGVFASDSLAAQGIGTVRFQFPYAEAGRRRPDPPAVLEETWRAVIEAVHSSGQRLVVGGRSMGGRIASQVVASGAAVDALALFAYPLHPPANPTAWRDKHLPQVKVATLFCSGTRDSFGSPEELQQAASKTPAAALHLLEGADHGFQVQKSSGRTRRDVWEEAVAALVRWLGEV